MEYTSPVILEAQLTSFTGDMSEHTLKVRLLRAISSGPT